MIAENISRLKSSIGNDAELIIVSKYRSIDEIMEAYHCGHRAFAENRVQALAERAAQLPQDIEWHLIGHLQTNKVKLVLPLVELIQSVDSLKLLWEIDKEAGKLNKIQNCLLEIKIAKEESKYGFEMSECRELFTSGMMKEFKNVRILGLMGMATFTENKEQISAEFSGLKNFYDELNLIHQAGLKKLSMGMSGDYQLALESGSNMLRIGSAVFS